MSCRCGIAVSEASGIRCDGRVHTCRRFVAGIDAHPSKQFEYYLCCSCAGRIHMIQHCKSRIRSVVINIHRYRASVKDCPSAAQSVQIAAVQSYCQIISPVIRIIYLTQLQTREEFIDLRYFFLKKHQDILTCSGQPNGQCKGRAYGISVCSYVRQYYYAAGFSYRFRYLFQHLFLSCRPEEFHL